MQASHFEKFNVAWVVENLLTETDWKFLTMLAHFPRRWAYADAIEECAVEDRDALLISMDKFSELSLIHNFYYASEDGNWLLTDLAWIIIFHHYKDNYDTAHNYEGYGM